jgi:hypothetical protein
VPRRNALIVIGVGLVAVVAAIVLLWNKGESGSTAAFCASIRTGENPLDVYDRYDPSNVDSARDQLQQGLDRLKQLERAAPGDIHGDMTVLADVADQLLKALDPSAKNKPVPDFTRQFDRVRVASANVTRFATDRCGATLDAASSAPFVTLVPESPTSHR